MSCISLDEIVLCQFSFKTPWIEKPAEIFIDIGFVCQHIKTCDRSFEIFLLFLFTSAFDMGFVSLSSFFLSLSWAITLMQDDSLPRVFFSVESSIDKMLIGLIVRTIVDSALLLEILGSEALAWDQWNLFVYEAWLGSFRIVDIIHVGVLVKSKFSIWVVVIIKCDIIHVNFEWEHIVRAIVANFPRLRSHISIMLDVCRYCVVGMESLGVSLLNDKIYGEADPCAKGHVPSSYSLMSRFVVKVHGNGRTVHVTASQSVYDWRSQDPELV